MADNVPDIEQAPEHYPINIKFEPAVSLTEPPFIKSSPEKDAKIEAKTQLNIEAEKIVILSFRGLQLERISELQDELLRLSIISASSEAVPSDHKEKVDKVMGDYAAALRNYETLSINALPSVPPAARLIGLMGMSAAEQPPTSFLEKARAKLAELFPSREYYLNVSSLVEDVQKTVEDAKKAIEDENRSTSKSILTRALELKPRRSAHQGLRVNWKVATPLDRTYAALDGALRSARSTEGIPPSAIIKAMELSTGNLGFRELDQQGRLLRAQKKALTERIIMAMFGGVALIGPMLIMTLHQSRNTSLITVSVATFIFALILAVGATDSTGKDVLGATAAYAAVLVVFVGTSSGGGS